MTSGAWLSLGLTGARAAAFVLALTAVGFGLASLGRHTAVALGTALVVAIVGEVGVRILLNLVKVPHAGQYLLSSYGAAWLTKSWRVVDQRPCAGACGDPVVITWPAAGVVLSTLVAAVLAAALWSVRRR